MPYADPGKRKAYMQEYRRKNATKVKKRIKEWKQRHPDKIRLYSKQQRARNPAKADAASQAWRVRYPHKDRAVQARRRARILATPVNDFTADQWLGLQEQYDHKCAYCRQSAPLTQDHVVPLSKGGTHTLSNILPACRRCNQRKGTKSVALFLSQLDEQPAPQAA